MITTKDFNPADTDVTLTLTAGDKWLPRNPNNQFWRAQDKHFQVDVNVRKLRRCGQYQYIFDIYGLNFYKTKEQTVKPMYAKTYLS